MTPNERLGDLAVYVPNPDADPRDALAVKHIAPESGIVGAIEPEGITGMVVIDYEGNLYGAGNLKRWGDRVGCAEGRHRAQYPTVARIACPLGALTRVGTLRARAYEREPLEARLEVSDAEALARWLGYEG
jgi:hypothetical protein